MKDRWSLASYFATFRGSEYLAFKTALEADLAAVQTSASGPITARFSLLESLSARLGHLSSYLGCLSADDSNDEAVKLEEAAVDGLHATLAKFSSKLKADLAALTEAAFASFRTSPEIAGAEHTADRLREAGRKQMAAEQEALAADLGLDGISAWGRLYETLTGKLRFTMSVHGRTEEVPMAKRRALMADPDRAVRLAAFRDGQQPWIEHQDTFAAALNAIAGTRHSLYRWRKIDHFLDTPLFSGALRRETLEAMLTAIHANIEIPRRILTAAAKLQGTAALHFADLEAPQVKPADQEKPIPWAEACSMVSRSFGAAYPNLGRYFDTMLDQQWIEAQPRPGKRPGAFCTGSDWIREERIYMTYHDTVHDVVTLAHEAGHAWHSCLLRSSRPFARDYPMTLAETASNFGEMILLDGLKREGAGSAATLNYLLDQDMNRAHAYLVNIPMRYEFERRFYEERSRGEVPVSRLRELMTSAQRDLYGDTLEPAGDDPMFWASKMHFFITGVSFYNFPYVFGYLLSQALYARFAAEGPSFLPAYEAFLRRTGSADCEVVARETLDADLADPAFWAASIQALLPAITRYEEISRTI